MSRFIYSSSEENNIGNYPNADFRINFHQPLEILPNSEIRVTECRINPKNDVVEINENNNILAFSIGSPWGNEIGGYGSYYKVKLNNGIYKIEQGDDNTYLNFHLKEKMNEAITNNSLFKGGIDVQITNTSKLNFKISQMNANNHYYEIPTGNSISEINDGLLNDFQKSNLNKVPFSNGDFIVKPFNLTKSGAIAIQGDAQPYYGCSLIDGENSKRNYFMSPPLNFLGIGDLETDSFNPLVVCSIDLRNYNSDTSFSLNLIGEGNVGCFYPQEDLLFENTDPSSFLYEIQNSPTLPQLSQCPFKLCFFNIPNDNDNVGVCLLFSEASDEQRREIFINSVPKNQILKLKLSVNNELDRADEDAGKCQFKCEMWDGTNTVLINETFNTINLGLFQKINDENNRKNWVINEKGLGQVSTMRFAISGYSYDDTENERFPIGFDVAVNYDPQQGANGFFNGNFQNENALTANNNDTIMPFVIYGDSTFQLPQYRLLIDSFTNVTDYYSGYSLLNNINSNCGSNMGIDEVGFQGQQNDLYSNGLIANDVINTNSRENALYFISVDDLPILNYTGNVSTGSLNKFIYTIDFNSGSGNRNNIYTSKPEIEKFNKLFNQQTLRISNMRIRITNIRGETVENLDDHTYIVFEIRENPLIKQQNLMKKFMDGMNIKAIQGNSITPVTSQFQ